MYYVEAWSYYNYCGWPGNPVEGYLCIIIGGVPVIVEAIGACE